MRISPILVLDSALNTNQLGQPLVEAEPLGRRQRYIVEGRMSRVEQVVVLGRHDRAGYPEQERGSARHPLVTDRLGGLDPWRVPVGRHGLARSRGLVPRSGFGVLNQHWASPITCSARVVSASS